MNGEIKEKWRWSEKHLTSETLILLVEIKYEKLLCVWIEDAEANEERNPRRFQKMNDKAEKKSV